MPKYASLPAMSTEKRILKVGEFYHNQFFGPDTVNQGAVLMVCTWDGGIFELGTMMGGLFLSGEFRGGSFWGGVFWEGDWRGGSWESGYDRHGRYRPRTDAPPHD